MKTLLLSLLVLLSLQNDNASIEGRVVRSTNQSAVAGARVLLSRIGGQLSDYRTAVTSDSGTFAFRNLAPGSYRVFVEREDYVLKEFGQADTGASNTPIAVKRDAAIKDIAVMLTPTGTIAGRVSKSGSPARGVWIYALRPMYRDGVRQFEPMQPVVKTNDLGDYRLFDLPPGNYFVIAAPSEPPRIEGNNYIVPTREIPAGGYFLNYRGPTRTSDSDALAAGIVDPAAFLDSVDMPTYHPGTSDPAAALPIEVRPGALVGGVDFKIERVQTVSVRGRVLNGITGQPAEDANLTLAARGPSGPSSISVRSQGGSNSGRFLFTNVAPGAYEIHASAQGLRGRVALDAGGRNLDDIQVVLQPSTTIQAKVRIDGRTTAANERDPDLAGIVFELHPFGALVPLRPDRTATLETWGPGEYRLSVRGIQPHLYVKSLRLGSAELLNSTFRIDSQPGPLEMVLSVRGGKASGMAVDARQQPMPGSRVALIPAAHLRTRFDLYRSATTDASGHWELEGIAPGDYKIFAWERIVEHSWQDPAVVGVYESQGAPIQFREGERRSVTLKVIPGPQ